MIKHITAKTFISTVNGKDEWFGLRYNFNIYRGCIHQCIYCDSRSECYQIENFEDLLVKTNAPDLARKELSHKRVKGLIGTGSMSDPYNPAEKEFLIMREVLKVIQAFRFPIHILTKSDLVLRDQDIIKEISRVKAYVSFTVTAYDDELSKKIEPFAPVSSRRIAAMKQLAENGINTGILLMPTLPYITDSEDNIKNIMQLAVDNGASYVIASFGVTMRDRQREYYYKKLEKTFPGLKEKYVNKYGNKYSCRSENYTRLNQIYNEYSLRYNLKKRVESYNEVVENLRLFS
ncbi:MAG TPA: radical SAM protein [Petrotogaceae bacterium]|jgi:DNA repair photolyase|nr:radical SAM protein [Petrotogaceae bacterium]HQF34029.1 radical SAM protein [Petrotogaceae bacterium]HQH33714.1 radical SAM protein [Petrotogaceae bacterium]HQI79685.1 radical SAM protein [Petrotogaceae bacterium]HQO12805.1 radical SAM protein [Petrotogaceae bacterium]